MESNRLTFLTFYISSDWDLILCVRQKQILTGRLVKNNLQGLVLNVYIHKESLEHLHRYLFNNHFVLNELTLLRKSKN